MERYALESLEAFSAIPSVEKTIEFFLFLGQ